MPELQKYVPRHLRLGVCVVPDETQIGYQEEKREIPILDDNGNVIEIRSELVRVPAEEAMSKYRVDDFRLSVLQKQGVSLKMINVNRSTAFTISELERISQNIDNQEKFVNEVLRQREEQRSWFAEPDDLEDKKTVEQ